MDLVNRLKSFLESQKIAISQFADTCKIPRPTMSQILNGRNKKISDELITKIHDAYPQLSVLWLMFGEGQMMVESNIGFSERQNGLSIADSNDQSAENERLESFDGNDLSSSEIRSEKYSVPESSNFDESISVSGENEQFDNAISDFELQSTASNFKNPQGLSQNLDTPQFSGTSTKQSQPQFFGQDKTPETIDFGPKEATETRPITDTIRNAAEINSRNKNLNSSPFSTAASTKSISLDETNSIPLSTPPGKKISTIVVLYSDNSFDIFNPAN